MRNPFDYTFTTDATKPPPRCIGQEATAAQHRARRLKKPPPRSTGQEATAAQHRARSHRRAAPGKKPPPRHIGQEATATPHRARSHRRAASGKKPPPRRIGQVAGGGPDRRHPAFTVEVVSHSQGKLEPSSSASVCSELSWSGWRTRKRQPGLQVGPGSGLPLAVPPGTVTVNHDL